MPLPISGPTIPIVPSTPSAIPAGPGGLVRPSDLTRGSLPPGPGGLTGRAPQFLRTSVSMPPRRNALPTLRANLQRNVPLEHPHAMPPPGGNTPPLAHAALSAAHVSSNGAVESQDAMMAQMLQTNLKSIQQQMQMAEMESIKSMATALANAIKSVGKGVADLAR